MDKSTVKVSYRINLEFFNGAKYLSKINIKTLLLKQELNFNEKELTTSRPTLQ